MPDDHLLITDGATIAYQLSSPPNTVPVGYGHGVLMSRQIVRGLGIFDIDTIAEGRRLITYDQRGRRITGPTRTRGLSLRAGSQRSPARPGRGRASMNPSISPDPRSEPLQHCTPPSTLLADSRRLALVIPSRRLGNRAQNPCASGTSACRPHRLHWDNRLATTMGRNSPTTPIFANYRHGKFEPGVDDDVVSAALRGVGSSIYPTPIG